MRIQNASTGESPSGATRVSIDELRRCLTDALRRVEVPDGDAGEIADVLLDAELRGYYTHGVFTLGRLVEWIAGGQVKAAPDVRVVSETDGALVLDADRGCGVGPALRAMRWCVERARARRGMACAAVRNSGYSVVAAPYAGLAAQAGMIGFACSNCDPLAAAPGGRTRVLGTNPQAYGIPGGRHGAIIFDMASTTIAAMKASLAAHAEETVAEGLVLEADGSPTTDPSAFRRGGAFTWLGHPHAAHKGFGLGLVLDVLSGVLSGGHFGAGVRIGEARSGQFFWALDVEAFMPLDEFRGRVDALVDHVKAGDPPPGAEEILVPGERSGRRRAALLAEGVVPLTPEVWKSLEGVCERLGVPLPG